MVASKNHHQCQQGPSAGNCKITNCINLVPLDPLCAELELELEGIAEHETKSLPSVPTGVTGHPWGSLKCPDILKEVSSFQWYNI